QILINEFHRLYPEYTSDNIAAANIPDTITKKAYFVQSPKGKDGLPSIHYSLKEKMLSDFRSTRSRVKKEMERAAESGDRVGEVRFNAKQLAIKIICNSEYGASNNEYFAHYDPDVAAAVTYASRQLIHFLTNNLETSALYVDQKFLDENRKQIDALSDIDCVSIEPYRGDDLFERRRHTIRRIFDDAYNIVCPKIFKLNIEPSTVCYQDTDSNYYRNDYITNYFTKLDDIYVCSPETINDCMHLMLYHNQLIANFAKAAIQRRPYALGFEGAFIICRYLNRKKKYYGIKWGDDAELRLGYKLSPEAYDENGHLIKDYSKFWKPKETVIPQPNGEYIYLDVNKLLNEGVNYLDYVHDQNVKCTGVDLARRDQYKFINFYHIVVLQKDLRLMKYLGDDEWEVFSKDESMKSIIDDLVENFRDIIDTYTDIANLKNDKHPEINFHITDFSKNGAYRQGKQNAVSTIVRRLNVEGKTQYIPTIGERMSYVIILDEKTEQERLMGKAAMGKVAASAYVIQELLDDLYIKYPEEEFNEKVKLNNLQLTYEEFINAKAICMLDFKYYLECLCKSMALYIVGDLYPEVIKDIDDGIIDPKTAGQRISKLQLDIAKTYVNKYFYTGRDISTHINRVNKELKSYVSEKSKEGMDLLYKVYPQIRGREFTKEDKILIQEDCETQLEKHKSLSMKMGMIYKYLLTNYFNKLNNNDKIENMIYEKFKNEPDKLLEEKIKCDKKIAIYEEMLREVNGVEFITTE
ncbi:MAG: DNA polymerase domain-containing protein, partial [Patescibacteria group bacterium]